MVFVVGLAEDLVPGRLDADALLPDGSGRCTGGQLPPLRERVDRQHRHLLAAFAAAPECIASFPRGDLRRSSARLPSRWLLPTLRPLSGQPLWRPPAGIRLQRRRGWSARRPTPPASAGTDELATEQEWRTRAAARRAATGAWPLDDVLAGDDVVRRRWR